MKKTLYVTDLDGTLLNAKSELSSYSETKIISLLNHGIHFTVASLRSIVTINSILENLPLKLPVIEMNGAFLTDFKSNRKLMVNTIDPEIKESLIGILQKYSLSPIIYCYHNDKDLMYMGDINNSGIKWYYTNRIQNRDPRLTSNLKLNDIMNMVWIEVITIDELAKLEIVRQEIESRHKNVYTNITESLQTPGYRWFTLNSATANKSAGILSLKKYLDMRDYFTVVFGDQPIDIPMFKISDLSVAVENAHPYVKNSADLVIGNNDSDAVVDFIESHYNKNK